MGPRMTSPPIAPPPPLLESLSAWVRAADAPAHETARLAQASLIHTAARAALGLVALAASALAISALRDAPGRSVDVLALVLEALLTVAPVTLAVTVWSAITTPRVLLAALALGLLTAGWVALGLVPLAAFTALVSPPASVSSAGVAVLDVFALLLVVCALASVVLVLRRVLRALDPSALTHWVSTGFAVAVFAVAFVRAQPWIGRLTGELSAW